VFGGRVDIIRTLLTEERFVEGWETNIKTPNGLTIAEISKVGLEIELTADTSKNADQQANVGHSAPSSHD